MTRPGLVRADTIDLQNQDAPSTQDHATHSLPTNDIGKHQAAEIRNVMHDRHSEEETLQDAWHRATDDIQVQELTDDQLQADHHEHADANDDSEIDDDMLDDRISSSPSIDDEDIDFDFVYALHTFVATVEGQANATKGDTMVLLDDSNSYWWLVRIVKDNSIGYLPAEHIETPTERLARLNKHRNVDLSAAMLGDSTEKSKNPLKKAMKRRNAKTVQFTAPTFVEASDYDYSSDEEDGMVPEPLYANNTQQEQSETISNGKTMDSEEEPSANDITKSVVEVARADTPESPSKDINPPVVEPLSSPTLVDKTEAAPLKSSRKGTPRNADSFLKDDGAEPRKISLTPNLLREDGNGGRSLDYPGSSMESLEKSASPPDRSKDEKKKKEKKPGMLSGLFKSKKKDKKHKNSVDEDSDIEKVSGELARQASAESPKTSYDQRAAQFSASEPKSRGKLQKPRQGDATLTSPIPAIAPIKPVSPILPREQLEQSTNFVAELEGSTVAAPASRDTTQFRHQEQRSAADTLLGSTTLSSITNKIRPSDSQDNPKPKKAKKAKTRVELDDFDELSGEEERGEDDVEFTRNNEADLKRTADRASGDESMDSHAFMHGTEMIHIPVNLGDDSSSPDEHETNGDRGDEESSNSTSPPSMIDTPKESSEHERSDMNDDGYAQDMTDDDQTPLGSKAQSETTMASGKSTPQPVLVNSPPARRAPSPPQRSNSVTPSISSSTRLSPSPASTRSPASTAGTANTWSDASLRAWLDGAENDVRDMLVIIHDKSAVVPVARNHPLMADLFTDESRRLAGLQDELDGLLGNWLATKKSGSREVPMQ